jgi:Zinc dependent phospholipase C
MDVPVQTTSQKKVSLLPFPFVTDIVHWPPFLKAAVEYIRETYPDPKNNEKAQALIAFIFAVSGHQVQDAAWHSIGLLMGFIDEVANVDCHDNFQNAHEILDWGGDAIFGKRFSGQSGASDWAFV